MDRVKFHDLEKYRVESHDSEKDRVMSHDEEDRVKSNGN